MGTNSGKETRPEIRPAGHLLPIKTDLTSVLISQKTKHFVAFFQFLGQFSRANQSHSSTHYIFRSKMKKRIFLAESRNGLKKVSKRCSVSSFLYSLLFFGYFTYFNTILFRGLIFRPQLTNHFQHLVTVRNENSFESLCFRGYLSFIFSQ